MSDLLFGEGAKWWLFLLKKAKALIYPSSWESFGISVIEAMVSGTPVIVSDIPPFREIVQDGITGFVCRNKQEYIKAIEQLPQIKPSRCRDWVMERFTHDRMEEGYEKLYLKVLKGEHW